MISNMKKFKMAQSNALQTRVPSALTLITPPIVMNTRTQKTHPLIYQSSFLTCFHKVRPPSPYGCKKSQCQNIWTKDLEDGMTTLVMTLEIVCRRFYHFKIIYLRNLFSIEFSYKGL